MSIRLIFSQSHYVDKFFGKFNMDDSAAIRNPLYISLHLSKNKGKFFYQLEHFRVIGSLMHLTSCARLDLENTVTKLARYASNPRTDH